MVKLIFSALAVVLSLSVFAQKKDKNESENSKLNSALVSDLKFRNIGPALISGRIADIAVNPNNTSEYYLAVASGGVWKTTNHGNTFEPIFDSYGSYSIGCITIDPNNSNTLWVGTGENNNQRSVAYGDGVYKSIDGGKSWQNVGLKQSEHISKIIVDPNNSDIVYVAAYGPLWCAGGDRGVYKTMDGGKTWQQIFFVSENTGIADLVMDPQDNQTLYCAAHQRRRHVYTYIGGGKESGIFKSTDGGQTWNELKSGLPTGKMGRVGLAISPVNSNYIYAILEAEEGKGGFFKSTDKGASWAKQSGYKTSGNYYQEIICDPKDVNKVFSMNTWLHHTEDGGKTWKRTGEKSKHVDNHCIWINPEDTDHWIVGCDGGLYETWDHAENWKWTSYLPLVQFYKVALDNDYPFYNVYGGTQDNNSVGGPSGTINNAGILNSDWYITNGGDGFESQVDPKDPNIVYAQAQYGWLVRYDKQSGEKIGIQPQPKKGEAPYRWNWDAPLAISSHDNHRLYFCANKVFKSDDQGNTWTVISEDLTRQLDRNQMKVMGEVQRPEVVMKNKSTTIYGNIVAFSESSKNENLLYAGTDDGLIQITTDGGKNWTKKSDFNGVPEMTYVNMLLASQHDENIVYAVFNNHKNGDFKPYVMKSTDKGNTWQAIQSNLPERGSVYAIAEDHINPNLLFVGTEFGVYFTLDAGKNWIQLKSGLPTVAVRDIAIQKRENDLVLATFGRGFYILDDYSVLRDIEQHMEDEAFIFPIKDGLEYIPSNPLGLRGRGHQGEGFYLGENPSYGVTFRYYLDDVPLTLKAKRQADEKKAIEDHKDISYPSNDEFFKEDQEEDPFLLFVIKDINGNEIQKIKTNASKGLHSVKWNLRYPSTTPVQIKKASVGRYSNPDEGPLALPGTYSVEFYLCNNGEVTKQGNTQSFKIKALENSSLDRQTVANIAFKKQLSEIRRQVLGTNSQLNEMSKKLKYYKSAILTYPNANLDWLNEVKKLELQIVEVEYALWGESHLGKRDVETNPGTGGRIETIVYQTWYSTSDPTTTHQEQFNAAKSEYEEIKVKVLAIQNKMLSLEEKLNANGIPYTPNRENFRAE
ncbi:MAG: WD40/YVTN/BNR-like repeat-containing protein [Putridiphycobacter sp.]